MKRIVTINEIARLLDVSASTVSRALQNHPRIGKETTLKVQSLARELNFEPNIQAIFFKQKRTHTIAVVVPSVEEYFFSAAVSAIAKTAEESNYRLIIYQSKNTPHRQEDILERLQKYRADGIIIYPSAIPQVYTGLQKLQKSGIPIICLGHGSSTGRLRTVCCDLYKGTIDLLQLLVKKGHSRIGLINGPDNCEACRILASGYCAALSETRNLDKRLLEKTDLTKTGNIKAVSRMMALRALPTAIISFDDHVHLDITEHLASSPLSKSVITFASYSTLSFIRTSPLVPDISLEQHPYLQGELAISWLLHLLQDTGKTSEAKTMKKEIEGTIVMRKTAI